MAVLEIPVPLPPRRARAQSTMEAATPSAAHGWALACSASSGLCSTPWRTVQVVKLRLDPLVHGDGKDIDDD
jgi:hypothetical protein